MNNLSMVIQSVIWKSESPVSGYDIATLIKDKTGNSHQQIYRELKKLSQRNDVIVDLIPQEGKPDKRFIALNQERVLSPNPAQKATSQKRALVMRF